MNLPKWGHVTWENPTSAIPDEGSQGSLGDGCHIPAETLFLSVNVKVM